MATRKLAISNEHVNAINLVEVDYFGCATVQAAWKTYRAHLYDETQGEVPNQAWHDKRDNLLARMLFEMGKVLKYDIPAIEISRAAMRLKVGFSGTTRRPAQSRF